MDFRREQRSAMLARSIFGGYPSSVPRDVYRKFSKLFFYNTDIQNLLKRKIFVLLQAFEKKKNQKYSFSQNISKNNNGTNQKQSLKIFLLG